MEEDPFYRYKFLIKNEIAALPSLKEGPPLSGTNFFGFLKKRCDFDKENLFLVIEEDSSARSMCRIVRHSNEKEEKKCLYLSTEAIDEHSKLSKVSFYIKDTKNEEARKVTSELYLNAIERIISSKKFDTCFLEVFDAGNHFFARRMGPFKDKEKSPEVPVVSAPPPKIPVPVAPAVNEKELYALALRKVILDLQADDIIEKMEKSSPEYQNILMGCARLLYRKDEENKIFLVDLIRSKMDNDPEFATEIMVLSLRDEIADTGRPNKRPKMDNADDNNNNDNNNNDN